MTPLGRESMALITAGRRAPGMSTEDKLRIRLKIAQRIGAGLVAGTTLVTGTTVAQATHATWWAAVSALLPTTAKVAGAVVLSMAVGAAVVDTVERTRPPPPAAASARPSLERAKTASTLALKTVPSAIEPAIEPPIEPGSAAERVQPVEPRAVQRTTLKATQSPPVNDALNAQVAAIREARTALRRGDARSALDALDALAAAGPGPLEQEALIARVSALCLQGDKNAALRVAEQFLARFGNSLLVPQLRTTCAFDSNRSD